jgi:hypothetical protein
MDSPDASMEGRTREELDTSEPISSGEDRMEAEGFVLSLLARPGRGERGCAS